MPVVDVGIVRVAMHNGRMPMRVDVRLVRRTIRGMLVAVVLVVDMGVLVNHCLMLVLMFVALDQMQICPNGHQGSRSQQLVTGSPITRTANAAPIRGAVEKYAPVRADPR
jgi:hypothetical protein